MVTRVKRRVLSRLVREAPDWLVEDYLPGWSWLAVWWGSFLDAAPKDRSLIVISTLQPGSPYRRAMTRYGGALASLRLYEKRVGTLDLTYFKTPENDNPTTRDVAALLTQIASVSLEDTIT